MPIVQFPPPSTGSRALHDMTPNQIAYGNPSSTTIPNNTFIDLVTVTGSGILGEFYVNLHGSNQVGLSVVIDGVEIPQYSISGAVAMVPLITGGASYTTSSGTPSLKHSQGLYRFAAGFSIRLRNLSTSQSASLTTLALQGVYYT